MGGGGGGGGTSQLNLRDDQKIPMCDVFVTVCVFRVFNMRNTSNNSVFDHE